MITRDDYMSGRATHAEYYGEIARACGISYANNELLPDVIYLLQTGDKHLNRIRLKYWDRLSYATRHIVEPQLAKRGNHGWSLADGACVHKQAAIDAALAFPFEAVVDGFWEAAYFAERDEEDPEWGEVSASAYNESRLRCAQFFYGLYVAAPEEGEPRREMDPRVIEAMRQIRENPLAAGHDFLLTMNGHGAGFWDGDWDREAPEMEIGKLLASAAHSIMHCDFYVGDDGVLYISGSENA